MKVAGMGEAAKLLNIAGVDEAARVLVAGVDEAGRGPLAGSVVAAAVILNPARPIKGLNDSKKLSEKERDRLAPLIREHALAWAVAEASVIEIDTLNIHHATLLAMRRAVEMLAVSPDAIEVDGLYCPKVSMQATAIVKGDSKVAAIAAASILAKTYRDAQMLELHARYPAYGLDKHKGYPTAAHLEALREHGVVREIYRSSYAPVRLMLSGAGL
jgi:ribonuclease HII